MYMTTDATLNSVHLLREVQTKRKLKQRQLYTNFVTSGLQTTVGMKHCQPDQA